MGNDKEIQPIEMPVEPVNQQSMSMPQVIQYAIQNNAGVDQLEKMMELQERYEANEARKAYHMAMAQFKANPPKINKDAEVDYTSQKGRTNYRHATLSNVTEKINARLSEYGLSASWQTEQADKKIKVTCKITHVMGHSENTTLEAEPDSSGNKNSIQAIGSSITYLERYTLLALTGLATHEDDDGEASGTEYISEEQLMTLNDWIENTDTELKKFLQFMKVDQLDKVKAKDYQKALGALKAKERKNNK